MVYVPDIFNNMLSIRKLIGKNAAHHGLRCSSLCVMLTQDLLQFARVFIAHPCQVIFGTATNAIAVVFYTTFNIRLKHFEQFCCFGVIIGIFDDNGSMLIYRLVQHIFGAGADTH